MWHLKRAWDHFWLWIEWHGKLTSLSMILIALAGSALANRALSIWGPVSGVYLWIFTGLVFAIFLCTLSIAGSKLHPMPRGGLGTRVEATAHVLYLIPDIDGPEVLLEYNWSEEKQDLASKPMLLSNVGNEAFGVQIHNVQRGKWIAKFPRLDVIRRDSPPIPVQPTMEYDGHAFPVQQGNFISLLKQENDIEEKTEVNVAISYRDIRARDFATHYSITYNAARKEAQQRFQRWGRLVEAHQPNAWNRIKGYVLRAFGREYLVR